jgi:hypothetical protein
LQPSKIDIQIFRTTHPADEHPVVLVDTPGFGDENLSIQGIRSEIANWIAKTLVIIFEVARVEADRTIVIRVASI